MCCCFSGHAVQSLVEFRTSGALRWLAMTGHASLLERTGLARALCEGRSFRSSRITNITLGGKPRLSCPWVMHTAACGVYFSWMCLLERRYLVSESLQIPLIKDISDSVGGYRSLLLSRIGKSTHLPSSRTRENVANA